MNKLLNEPERIDEAFLSSLIKKEHDKIVYKKKGYGEIETDRPISSIRLELALDYSGLSQTQLSTQANVPQGTISRIITGRIRSSAHFSSLSKHLNVDERWLSGYDLDNINLNRDTKRLIIGANMFFLVADYDENSQAETLIDRRLLNPSSNPKELRFIIAPDNAMSPDIRLGSSVIFDISENKIINGETYVVNARNQIQIRQLFLEHDDLVRLKARNSDFYEYTLQVGESLQILGRIISVANSYI